MHFNSVQYNLASIQEPQESKYSMLGQQQSTTLTVTLHNKITIHNEIYRKMSKTATA